MTKNIGTVDRAIRFATGIAFILLGYTSEKDFVLEMLALGFGMYLIFTALFETCLLYLFLGLRTKVVDKKPY